MSSVKRPNVQALSQRSLLDEFYRAVLYSCRVSLSRSQLSAMAEQIPITDMLKKEVEQYDQAVKLYRDEIGRRIQLGSEAIAQELEQEAREARIKAQDMLDVEVLVLWENNTWEDSQYLAIPANTPANELNKAVEHAAAEHQWGDHVPTMVLFHAFRDVEDVKANGTINA